MTQNAAVPEPRSVFRDKMEPADLKLALTNTVMGIRLESVCRGRPLAELLEDVDSLAQMLPSELEAEAREHMNWLHELEYQNKRGYYGFGNIETKSRNRLGFVRLLMGEDWFDRVAAPLDATHRKTLRTLYPCSDCGTPLPIELKPLKRGVCDECWPKDAGSDAEAGPMP